MLRTASGLTSRAPPTFSQISISRIRRAYSELAARPSSRNGFMPMPRWAPVLIFILFPSSGPAQSDSLRASDSARAVVEGTVVDPVGKPLPETEILWQTDRRSVMSRADGSFSLVVPVRELTVILVRRPGYNAQVLRVDLSRGMWRGRIVLEPGSLRLPDVVVDAKYAKPVAYASTSKYDGFFQRQKIGIGSFISREAIEKSGATHTLETLRGIPGVSVNVGDPTNPASADIRMPRCKDDLKSHFLGKVTVWIDGHLVGESFTTDTGEHGQNSLKLAEMLGRIAPSSIEMMEIYRGPGQIPGPFHWDGCAAIVIWTRFNPRRDTLQTGKSPPS